MSNNNIILVTGKPSSGKSTSLRNLPRPESVAYINTDLKALPIKNANDFRTLNITDAVDVIDAVTQIEEHEDFSMGVLDTLTFAMDMFESQYVTAKGIVNTQAAWGDYGKFYKDFIHNIKAGSKDYVIYAHEKDIYNETEMAIETKIPVKGAIGARGVEGDFTIILAAKRVPITKLEPFANELLTFSEEELEDGFKYVFQTRVTKDTLGEKMRSPMGLWSRKQLYIDNDINLVLNHVKAYYKG